jgi:uncharacterized protein YjbI with pentapeptide repeats
MRKALFVIILVLSVLVGWFFGYINFPFIDQSQSFWVGLIGGLAIMLLVIAITKSRSKLYNQGKISPKARLLLPIIMAILFVSVLFLFVKNRSLESRVSILKEQIPNTNSISSSQQVKFLAIMNSLLDTVGNELKSSKDNTLSTSTIGRIVAFSKTIESHQFISTDTGVYKKVSPVKGHLLLGLVHMNMDSSSFTQIKRQVSFAGADLSNADLSGYNLEGINLREANLAHSSLKGTNMSHSNLFGVNFYKAQMQDMNLSHSLLEKANLHWSNLSGSILFRANMYGVDLRNGNLMRTDLREVSFNRSLLNSAILVDADLTGSQLNGANLKGANLSNAKLINVVLLNSAFLNANLSNTHVDSAWLVSIKKWNIFGEDDVIRRYDISFDNNQACWRLQEKD